MKESKTIDIAEKINKQSISEDLVSIMLLPRNYDMSKTFSIYCEGCSYFLYIRKMGEDLFRIHQGGYHSPHYLTNKWATGQDILEYMDKYHMGEVYNIVHRYVHSNEIVPYFDGETGEYHMNRLVQWLRDHKHQTSQDKPIIIEKITDTQKDIESSLKHLTSLVEQLKTQC